MDTAPFGTTLEGSFLVNSREELLALKTAVQTGIRHCIPAELNRRYRGCRDGVSLKAADHWRRFKPSIPIVIMGNVNSLKNKMDELHALNNQRIYRECSLFIFMETWLTELRLDQCGFTAVRVDRHTEACRKSRGGGLTVYINNRWCKPGHVSIKNF